MKQQQNVAFPFGLSLQYRQDKEETHTVQQTRRKEIVSLSYKDWQSINHHLLQNLKTMQLQGNIAAIITKKSMIQNSQIAEISTRQYAVPDGYTKA